jgi:hypothetical protein
VGRETREDFDAFSGRIAAGTAAAGVEMQGRPDVKEYCERIHKLRAVRLET